MVRARPALVLLGYRLENAKRQQMEQKQHQLEKISHRVAGLNPSEVLKRGYAMVSSPHGVISTVAEAKQYSSMRLIFQDGSMEVINPKSKENSHGGEEKGIL